MNTYLWNTDQTFTSTTDGNMVNVYIPGHLIISSGVTVTVSNRCKGLYLQVAGNMYVNGTISMSARGASSAGNNIGIEVFSNKNTITVDDPNWASLSAVRKIPAAGAAGGVGCKAFATNGETQKIAGGNGSAGVNGQTGGGAAGTAYASSYKKSDSWNTCRAGVYGGAAGTSYSGGSGSGGAECSSGANGGDYMVWGTAGAINGGAGGNAAIYEQYNQFATGGAGNPAGISYGSATQNGTGGLLIVVTIGFLYISASGSIVSHGVGGGEKTGQLLWNTEGKGGGSGGGSVNVLTAAYSNNGSVAANGGGTGTSVGGAGSARINTLRA